jgi:predicted HicB family RNase H-like nuclease
MSETLQYKGYDGLVLYSAEDKLLYGYIASIRDMVTYEGAGIKDLEANFHAAVDEYLAFCKETGKTPDVPFKGTFNVRVGRDLHRRAALLAESRKIKLNTVVQQALEEYLSQAS